MADYSTFHLGDWALESGAVLPSAFIAYKTYGTPTLPAIIYPTWFTGLIRDNEWLMAPHRALSPLRYFIIVPALFGNGESSSPSNTRTRPFPAISIHDNVAAQYKLVTEGLGVRAAKCVLGWSMGAAQTYGWVVQFPRFVELAVPFCGSARTAVHNRVFLEGVRAALLAARGTASEGVGEWRSDEGWSEAERQVGLKAMARVYAGWGFSQAFYRERLYETELGYRDLEDFMVRFWETWGLSKNPENVLAMLHTWQTADCSRHAPFNGNFQQAMQSIQAKMLVLPGQTDLYFPPEDSEHEVQCMRPGVGKCVVIPSIWGHWAGGPGVCKADLEWLDEKLKAFLHTGSWRGASL